ncbi:MAG: hypothetical protein C0625_03080 [Arcobacter sp.]|mgnify:CR=1 FL=1|nr:MAG: hypothetical protein C0625_03080 [Arcobacter sp.]
MNILIKQILSISLFFNSVAFSADSGMDDFFFTLPWSLTNSNTKEYIAIVKELDDGYCKVSIYESNSKGYFFEKTFFGTEINKNKHKYVLDMPALCFYSSKKRTFEEMTNGVELISRKSQNKVIIVSEKTNVITNKTRVLIIHFEK